jgi:aminoglycoside phosphotransferase (APT) family kinase protein
MLLAGELCDDHVRQLGRMLGTIHTNAFQQQAAIAQAFADDSFFESLRLEPYYAYTATQLPEAAPFLNALIVETRQQRLTLVHGDYSPKNILVCDDRLILLDHEVIHFGDPAFDLGFSLTHLLSKAHYLPARRTQFAAAARRYWQAYTSALGAVPWAEPLEARAVRHTLGCLLARVAGRSPLEYLDATQQARQRRVVCDLIADPPAKIDALTTQFIEGIKCYVTY